jgi:hypothetical protein
MDDPTFTNQVSRSTGSGARGTSPSGDPRDNPCRRQGDRVVAPSSAGRRLLVWGRPRRLRRRYRTQPDRAAGGVGGPVVLSQRAHVRRACRWGRGSLGHSQGIKRRSSPGAGLRPLCRGVAVVCMGPHGALACRPKQGSAQRRLRRLVVAQSGRPAAQSRHPLALDPRHGAGRGCRPQPAHRGRQGVRRAAGVLCQRKRASLGVAADRPHLAKMHDRSAIGAHALERGDQIVHRKMRRPWPAAAAFSPPRPSSPGPASSPEAGDITPAGRLHRRGGFRKGLAYARPLRPRAISPRSRATKSVSSGSRSLRRPRRSTLTQAPAVSRRADSRESHTR